MKYLYKYPQAAFPYAAARRGEPPARTSRSPSTSCVDTGVFDDDRYFDVVVEYAKADAEDILVRITSTNRGPEAARDRCPAHALVSQHVVVASRLRSARRSRRAGCGQRRRAPRHRDMASDACTATAKRRLLFTENDTNAERLFGVGQSRRRT